MSDSRRTRVGSPRALNIRASCSASWTPTTPRATGVQHTAASGVASGTLTSVSGNVDGMPPSCQTR